MLFASAMGSAIKRERLLLGGNQTTHTHTMMMITGNVLTRDCYLCAWACEVKVSLSSCV